MDLEHTQPYGQPELPPAPPSSDQATIEAGEARKAWIERFLSPESLQRMMLCGGGLMILGFVTWLWSTGVFDSPLIAASAIGIVNVSVLAAGIGILKKTRYRLAGRGLTLLAGLAMPLNLWFYHAQGLMPLDEGAPLWIPAFICCVFYGLIARSLRDANFVYMLVGGVVMTGSLILADQSVGRFWELLPHVGFLTTVGCISLMAEFAFAPGEGEFSRQRFGAAFGRAGGLALVAGLSLLAGGRLLGYLPGEDWALEVPAVTTDLNQKLWAVGLLIMSSATLGIRSYWQKSVTQRSVALGLALWAGFIGLEMFGLIPNFSQVLMIGCLVLVADNLLALTSGSTGERRRTGATLSAIGVVTMISVTLLQYFAAANGPLNNWWVQPLGWTMVCQLAVVFATTCVVGQRVHSEYRDDENLAQADQVLYWLGGGLLSLSIWLAVGLIGVGNLYVALAILFSVPLAYAIANQSAAPGIRRLLEANSGSYLVGASVCIALELARQEMLGQHGLIAGILVPAGLMALGVGRQNRLNRGLGLVFVLGSVVQASLAFGWDVGLLLCGAGTLAGLGLSVWEVASRNADQNPDNATRSNACLLMVGSGLAGVLLVGNRMLTGTVDLPVVSLLMIQVLATAISASWAPSQNWKSALRASAISSSVATLVSLNQFLELGIVYRTELMAILSGMLALVIGHVQWLRERQGEREWADGSLLLGSLLLVIPLGGGLILHRLTDQDGNWWAFHEVAALTAGLLLLGSGILGRIRWTTIGGAVLLGTHLVSLFALVRFSGALQNVSVGMMVGGGVFFGTAILLSVYRDRIMELPRKVKQRRGVFQVLNWK